MRPAPFETVIHEDKEYGYSLISDPDENTAVIKKGEQIVWQLDEFIGRRAVNISPDGRTLVLFGSYYFASNLKIDDEIPVLVVIRDNRDRKNITLEQATGLTFAKVIKKFKLPVKGGGWVSVIRGFLEIAEIDWQREEIHLRLNGEKVFKVGY